MCYNGVAYWFIGITALEGKAPKLEAKAASPSPSASEEKKKHRKKYVPLNGMEDAVSILPCCTIVFMLLLTANLHMVFLMDCDMNREFGDGSGEASSSGEEEEEEEEAEVHNVIYLFVLPPFLLAHM
jgi:hypothetical protein